MSILFKMMNVVLIEFIVLLMVTKIMFYKMVILFKITN